MSSSTMTESRPESSRSSPRFRRRRVVSLLAVMGIVAGAVLMGWIWTLNSGLNWARQHMARSEWSDARKQLTGYLKLHPDDAEAHLLMAEAFVKDESAQDDDHLEQAFQHLQQISNDSPLAARARLQEARLRFVILFQPIQAEALLRESLELNNNSYEANTLMWKLEDLTGRHYLSSPYFWKAYELSSDREKPLRLREWFLSEFFPDSANAEYDRMLGIAATKKLPALIVRLLKFREAEPESPVHHAVLGWYFLDSKDPKTAVRLLGMAPDLNTAMADPLYVSVLFEALIDLGEFDKADACFQKWPLPHSGYDFWRCQGLRNQLILKNDRAAAVDFRRALDLPRGTLDWATMSRLANSLSRIGRLDEAEALRVRIGRLTKKSLTRDAIASIRKNLADLNKIDAVRKTQEFYSAIGLHQEARAWGNYLQILEKQSDKLNTINRN